jgi:NADPH:quinone reductase-like Zn-dependent oxidoreductase
LFKPKYPILGADFAGRVEAVGSAVTQFKVGDAIFGDATGGNGALAEYATTSEKQVALKPVNLSFQQAAGVPMAAITALQSLRDKGRLQPGQHVAINGASGGVGTFAVQIAKVLGAEVTAVCSTRNVELAQSLGADHVIDYKQQDFTASGQQYDMILAVNGYHPLAHYKRALKPGGIYVMAGGTNAQIFEALLLAPFQSMGSGKTLTSMGAETSQRDLLSVKELIETGKIKPIIDRCFPFREAVEAMRYIEAGHARGKVIVEIVPDAG